MGSESSDDIRAVESQHVRAGMLGAAGWTAFIIVWAAPGPEEGPVAIMDEKGIVGIGRRSPFLSN